MLTKLSNSQATCLITTLDARYGWISTQDGQWIYDPGALNTRLRPTLASHFNQKVGICINHDRKTLLNTIQPNATPSEPTNDIKEALELLSWPADSYDSRGPSPFASRFPLEHQYIAGPGWCSGYHIGAGIVGTAGHCLITQLLKNEIRTLKVVFGWSGDVRGKEFTASQIFDIEK